MRPGQISPGNQAARFDVHLDNGGASMRPGQISPGNCFGAVRTAIWS